MVWYKISTSHPTHIKSQTNLRDACKLCTEATECWLFLRLYIMMKLTLDFSCQCVYQHCWKFNCKYKHNPYEHDCSDDWSKYSRNSCSQFLYIMEWLVHVLLTCNWKVASSTPRKKTEQGNLSTFFWYY